ncbi:MAG: hypothetical protein J6A19_10870 [Oscillospiraceae bacterium]|nr:hypothetical protein [Oscillospiraceae bacterium]
MKDVVKKYGEGGNTIYALDHASLELEKGEICVILGSSGSGKYLTAKRLSGCSQKRRRRTRRSFWGASRSAATP